NSLVSTGVCITLVRLKREDRREGLGLVADGICERSNSAVDQSGAEAIGRAGRVHVRDDLQLVAQRHRGIVLDGYSQRRLEQSGVRREVVLDDAPIHGVVQVVEEVEFGQSTRK